MTQFTNTIASPVGALTLIASDAGLCAVLWENDDPKRVRVGDLIDAPQHPILVQAERELREYFAGERSGFDMPLDLQGGTAFQQSVWQALLAIPRGGTTSYGTLSQRIGKPAAVRAVGAAVGRNPVSVIVPCHRVLGAGGALTGYAGGLERKSALLQLEGAL